MEDVAFIFITGLTVSLVQLKPEYCIDSYLCIKYEYGKSRYRKIGILAVTMTCGLPTNPEDGNYFIEKLFRLRAAYESSEPGSLR